MHEDAHGRRPGFDYAPARSRRPRPRWLTAYATLALRRALVIACQLAAVLAAFGGAALMLVRLPG